MGKIGWDFPLLGNGNESGSNIAAITMFKGAGIMDGLAREVCQNSLDAKDKSLDEKIPVKVKFELHHIQKRKYPMFSTYEDAIKRSREYWNNSPLKTDKVINFLDSIENALHNEMIPVLVMSDYNTTGLRGTNPESEEKSYWDLLVNTEGISIKDDKSSAGSYGIGKNAPFAYSALNLVFYNTLATDGGKAFEGVARLATTTRSITVKVVKLNLSVNIYILKTNLQVVQFCLKTIANFQIILRFKEMMEIMVQTSLFSVSKRKSIQIGKLLWQRLSLKTLFWQF